MDTTSLVTWVRLDCPFVLSLLCLLFVLLPSTLTRTLTLLFLHFGLIFPPGAQAWDTDEALARAEAEEAERVARAKARKLAARASQSGDDDDEEDEEVSVTRPLAPVSVEVKEALPAKAEAVGGPSPAPSPVSVAAAAATAAAAAANARQHALLQPFLTWVPTSMGLGSVLFTTHFFFTSHGTIARWAGLNPFPSCLVIIICLAAGILISVLPALRSFINLGSACLGLAFLCWLNDTVCDTVLLLLLMLLLSYFLFG